MPARWTNRGNTLQEEVSARLLRSPRKSSAPAWPKYGGRQRPWPKVAEGPSHGRSKGVDTPFAEAPLWLAAADAAAHRSPQGPARWLKAPPWAREEERPPAAAMPRSGVLWALRLPANAAGPRHRWPTRP